MTYSQNISRILLASILTLWAAFFLMMAFDSAGGSIPSMLHAQYGVPFWATSLLCFSIAALFLWAGLSTHFSKSWQDDRFETVALSMSAALGVSLGFAGLTPQSEIWQLIAMAGLIASLSLSAIACGLLLAVSTKPLMEPKPALQNSASGLFKPYGNSMASEISHLQSLQERWQR